LRQSRLSVGGALSTIQEITKSLSVAIAFDLQIIAQGVDDCINSLVDKSPAEGSIVARELASRFGQPENELAGIGGVGLAVDLAYQTLATATDHLHASYRSMLGTQNEASVQRYTVFSVLRATLETAALTYWLVDPGIKPKERLLRSLRYLENSRRLRERVVGGIGNRDSLVALASMRDSIQRTSEHHGIEKVWR
jgi:hypothetical protein